MATPSGRISLNWSNRMNSCDISLCFNLRKLQFTNYLSWVAYKLHVGLFFFSGLWNSVLNYLNLRAGSKCLKGCFIIIISSFFVKENKPSSYFLWFHPTTHDNKHRPQIKFRARSLDTYHPQLPSFINITTLPVNQ